jgi:hypothetical protein
MLVALAGCGEPKWVYAPVRTTSAELAPDVEQSIYRVDPGEVRVATRGIVKLERGDLAVRAVVVEITVANRSRETWTLSGSDQRLFAGKDVFAASSDMLGAPPSFVVPPGAVRVIDLDFPIPPGYVLGPFAVVWTLHDHGMITTQRTAFRPFLEP